MKEFKIHLNLYFILCVLLSVFLIPQFSFAQKMGVFFHDSQLDDSLTYSSSSTCDPLFYQVEIVSVKNTKEKDTYIISGQVYSGNFRHGNGDLIPLEVPIFKAYYNWDSQKISNIEQIGEDCKDGFNIEVVLLSPNTFVVFGDGKGILATLFYISSGKPISKKTIKGLKHQIHFVSIQ